jgi:RHS repeat-associated protein
MTDEKGNIVWEVVDKHPFGEFEVKGKTVSLSDYGGVDSWSYTVENPLRFPGQYNDYNYRSVIISGKKGPYYNYHRWYNPDIGRYLEVDPYKIIYFSRVKSCYSNSIIQKMGHRYLYVMNNPIIILDISGLSCRNVNKCMTCFRIYGSDRLNDALSEVIGWDCDPYGDNCPKYETEHWQSAPHRCCGYAVPGSGWVTMTNVPMSDCDRDCFVLLHEIVHAVIVLEDDDDADSWARFNLPECCDLVGGR